MGIKYQVNEDFFKKWKKEMAYVLGYFYADGSLEDASYLRGKYIRVTSVEKNTILKIKALLSSQHKIVAQQPTTENGKKRHLLRIGSHTLYKDLQNLGLFPNKSLTMTFPLVPKKFLADFVRGYFDGDGCVYFWKSRGKTKPFIARKLCIIFTSGSKIFLEELLQVLRNHLGLQQQRIYNGHRSFQLSYSTSDSVKIFEFLYGNAQPPLFL